MKEVKISKELMNAMVEDLNTEKTIKNGIININTLLQTESNKNKKIQIAFGTISLLTLFFTIGCFIISIIK